MPTRSRVNEVDVLGGRELFARGGFGRFFAACAAALALALAELTAPIAANAARAETKSVPSAVAAATTTKKPTKASAATTGHIFSGLSLTGGRDPRMLLEEGARKQLDDFSDAAIKNMKEAVQAIDANINKTWMPQDVWLIIAWHFLITKGRKKAYNLAKKYLYKGQDQEKNTWEKSFWRWMANPMRVVGGLWVTTYTYDNAMRFGHALELTSFLPAEIEMIGGFDRGLYAMTAGIIAVMSCDRWLPVILERKFNVKDASQRLVISRLADFGVVAVTIVVTALSFGVRLLCPPS